MRSGITLSVQARLGESQRDPDPSDSPPDRMGSEAEAVAMFQKELDSEAAGKVDEEPSARCDVPPGEVELTVDDLLGCEDYPRRWLPGIAESEGAWGSWRTG